MTIASSLGVHAESGTANLGSVGNAQVRRVHDWGADVQGAAVGGARVWGAERSQEFTSVASAIAGATKSASGEGGAVSAGMSFRVQWETLVQRPDVQRSTQETAGMLRAEANTGTQTPEAARGPVQHKGANAPAQAVPTQGTNSRANSNAPDPAILVVNSQPVKEDRTSGETILPDAIAAAQQEAGQSSEKSQGEGPVHSTWSERRENLSTRNATASMTSVEITPGMIAVVQPLQPDNLTHAMPTPDLPANPKNSAGLTVAIHAQLTEVPDAFAGAWTGQPIGGTSATDITAAWPNAQARIGTSRQMNRVHGVPQSNANSAPADSEPGVVDPNGITGERGVSEAFLRQPGESPVAPLVNESATAETQLKRSIAQSLNRENVAASGREALACTPPAAAAPAARAADNGDSITKTNAEAAAQSAHEKGVATSGNSVAHVEATKGVVAVADSSVVMHVAASDRVAARGPVEVAESYNQAAASTAQSTRVGETFAALDASGGVGSPSWIHTGHQSAEAGFQDPALGWVGVRAELSGGNVHAALIPGSAEAAQALSTHLPGLSAHLSEERVPVSMVTMASPKESGFSLDTGQGQQQNTQQNEGQSGADAPNSGERDSQTSNLNGLVGSSASNKVDTGPAIWVGTQGAHISVMA